MLPYPKTGKASREGSFFHNVSRGSESEYAQNRKGKLECICLNSMELLSHEGALLTPPFLIGCPRRLQSLGLF